MRFYQCDMSGKDWDVRDGSIVEQPRNIAHHPLLARVYQRHDALISEYVPAGRTLEVACGRYLHPAADIGVEAYQPNLEDVETSAVAGDVRSLPFGDGCFDAVIGRRFLHHLQPADRQGVVDEIRRVLRPGGRCVVLEGTPGHYRRLTKGLADRFGLLGENHNIYNHCSKAEIKGLLAGSLSIFAELSLGSPVMVASFFTGDWSARLLPLYQRTQWVRWWTLFVAEKATD